MGPFGVAIASRERACGYDPHRRAALSVARFPGPISEKSIFASLKQKCVLLFHKWQKIHPVFV
jgi:hypothetical protein